jgi:hypothetical protein
MMRVDVGCALVAALFCTVAAPVLVGAGAPSWVAALGAIAWWFVLEFAIRTVVDEVRAFYGRFCVRSSGMDQRELHRESCQWRKGSGGAILGE